MASARKKGTNEVISTYGNATRDYTALATWAAATDNDLVTLAQSEVLECYDDAASFNDSVYLGDALCNASYFRIIRPAAGHGHDGTPNNGVYFVCTADVADAVFWVYESYSQVQDIIASYNGQNTGRRCVFVLNNGVSFTNSALIGCIAYNSSNTNVTGTLNGFYSRPNGAAIKQFMIDCLAHNMTTPNGTGIAAGFKIDTVGTIYWYNCSSIGNETNGFYQTAGTAITKNCCSSGNVNDWVGTFTKTTCTAEDATPTYVNAANDDFHLAAGDTVCRGNGTDLSADAIYPFDDDIDGRPRVSAWDIGFDEYTSIVPIIMQQTNQFNGGSYL